MMWETTRNQTETYAKTLNIYNIYIYFYILLLQNLIYLPHEELYNKIIYIAILLLKFAITYVDFCFLKWKFKTKDIPSTPISIVKVKSSDCLSISNEG